MFETNAPRSISEPTLCQCTRCGGYRSNVTSAALPTGYKYCNCDALRVARHMHKYDLQAMSTPPLTRECRAKKSNRFNYNE